MAHTQQIASVRSLVTTTFAELGVADSDQVHESLLVCGGTYCGRRFKAEEGQAVWFFEENEVKFYTADGSIARVLQLEPTGLPARLAA
jgi:hypothetical protein